MAADLLWSSSLLKDLEQLCNVHQLFMASGGVPSKDCRNVAAALIPFLVPDLPVQAFCPIIAASAHRPAVHVWVKQPPSVEQRQNTLALETFRSELLKAFSFSLTHIEKFAR